MASEVRLDSPRAWYVVCVLTLCFSLAYVDRQLLNLVVDPVKSTLGLTDTQFSLIQGLGFVSAYLIAIPIFGRLTDIGHRRNILIFGVAIWSICTALCGLADTYWELFAARFGVGAAEACVFPVSWSLIGDYFSSKRAPRAFSIFTIGSSLGGALSLIASGLVLGFASNLHESVPIFASLETWQMAFVVVGLPGLLMVPILLSVREPVRQKSAIAINDDGPMKTNEAVSALWGRKDFYGRIYLALGGVAIVQLGLPTWFPTYLIRVYEIPPAQVGYLIGFNWIIFATLGTLLGPVVSRWVESRGHVDAPLRVSAFCALIYLLFCAAIPMMGSATGALIASTGVMFFSGLPLGILAFATQHATPSRMRGLVSGLYSFCTQSIGYGIAPTIIALITDDVFRDPNMVGHSLQIVTVFASAMTAIMLFTVLPVYRRIVTAGTAPA